MVMEEEPVRARSVRSEPVRSSGLSMGSSLPEGCVRLNDKKYMERPSPAYSAADCPGLSLLGNNGKMYVSVANKNGIYTWKEKKSN